MPAFIATIGAALIAWWVTTSLAWPWWAGVLLWLVLTPVLGGALQYVMLSANRRSLIPRTGLAPGSPNKVVEEAYWRFAEASRGSGGRDAALPFWSQLREAAAAAGAAQVLAAIGAIEGAQQTADDAALQRAVRSLTRAIYHLK